MMMNPSFMCAVLVTLSCFQYGTSTDPENLKSGKDISVQSAISNISEAISAISVNYLKCKEFCSKPVDCDELHSFGYNTSGIYAIWPKSRLLRPESVRVYCDMETNGGGWTVIQRRGDYGSPEAYFYEDWNYYKTGFGSLKADFWLGNDNIHALTNQGSYELRIDLKHTNGTSAYAHYKTFWIDNEEQGYTLHIRSYSGNAGDGMAGYNNGKKFSTKDKLNGPSSDNDATKHKGGWWYSTSFYSNLNGLYRPGEKAVEKNVVSWHYFGGDLNCLQSTEMKIRPFHR